TYSFLFSSRRRHTRSKRDWSSDVCSSDLPDFTRGSWQKMMVSLHFLPTAPGEIGDLDGHAVVFDGEAGEFAQTGPFGCVIDILRAGERRVGERGEDGRRTRTRAERRGEMT